MRIVFLSHVDFNLYLFRLPVMKAMVKQGWEVFALCPEGEYSPRFADEGIVHIHYDIERSSLNPLKELSAIRNIAAALRAINADILHTFTVKPNIYGTLAARLAGTKTTFCSVTGLGSFFIESGPKAMFIRTLISILYRIVFTLAKGVVFQNGDDRELFIAKKIVSREKTHLIKGSGIDTTLWNRKNERGAEEQKCVLFIGRLLIHKGIREFIQAARIVKVSYPGVRFTVAGDFDGGNPYNLPKEEFDAAIEEGIIEFVGWQEDVRPLYEAADLFVLPSYREGMPRTAIEAASMGLPVITTDAVGCREVVEEGVNGYLVPIGESRKLADRIIRLLVDDALYHKMAENAREKAVSEFDIVAIVTQHLQLYGNV